MHRILRVEGADVQGRTGYYEKDLPEGDSASWVFHPTGLPLKGRVLANTAYDSSRETLGPGEDRGYVLASGPSGIAVQVPDFNCYNSPARLQVRLAEGYAFDLVLHYADTIRVVPRTRGIDAEPRTFSGAIEVPRALMDALDAQPAEVAEFIRANLEVDDGGRFTDVTLVVTADALKIKGDRLQWELSGE